MKLNMPKVTRLFGAFRTKIGSILQEYRNLFDLLRKGKIGEFTKRLKDDLNVFKKPRIGDLLIKKDLITHDQIEEALEVQRKQGGFLGQILIDLGYITENDVIRALTVQQQFPWLEAGVLAFVLIVFLFFSSWVWQKLQIRFYTVKEQKISSTIVANGVIEAEREARIAPTIMGKVSEIKVKEGDEVKQGQELIVLETAHLEAQFDQAKAQLEEVERDLERSRKLHESNVITTKDLEAMETQHRITEANVKLLENQLNESYITSPIKGTVVRIEVRKGEVAGPGRPMIKVIDFSDLLAIIKVDETQVESIHVGEIATLYLDAFPGKSLSGEIMEIDRASAESLEISLLKEEEDVKRFRVKIKVLDPFEGIRSGMTVWAYIPCWRDTIVIPKRAVMREGDVSMVWKKENGKLEARKIKTGIEDEKFVQVLRGLNNGDVIQSRGFKKP